MFARVLTRSLTYVHHAEARSRQAHLSPPCSFVTRSLAEVEACCFSWTGGPGYIWDLSTSTSPCRKVVTGTRAQTLPWGWGSELGSSYLYSSTAIAFPTGPSPHPTGEVLLRCFLSTANQLWLMLFTAEERSPWKQGSDLVLGG